MTKKHTNKLLKWEEIMIARQIIYWITNTFQSIKKLIAIDLSKQTELENPDLKQQINFIGRLERNGGATMFFTIEKSEETTSEFKQNAATDHGEGKKIVQPLNLKPKSLNQIFVIIQTHIFL